MESGRAPTWIAASAATTKSAAGVRRASARLAMTRTLTIIAAEAAIHESLGLGQPAQVCPFALREIEGERAAVIRHKVGLP